MGHVWPRPGLLAVEPPEWAKVGYGEVVDAPKAGRGADTTDAPTTGAPITPAVCVAPAGNIDPFPDPATCEDYSGSIGVAELEIGILNLRNAPVFVHSNPDAIEHRVLLTGDLGGRVVHAPYICDDDPSPCEELITGDLRGCPLIGFSTAPLRLDPGARHILRWTPYLAFPMLLPAACQPEFPADHTCTTAVPPAPGAYTLALTYAESPRTRPPAPRACTP